MASLAMRHEDFGQLPRLLGSLFRNGSGDLACLVLSYCFRLARNARQLNRVAYLLDELIIAEMSVKQRERLLKSEYDRSHSLAFARGVDRCLLRCERFEKLGWISSGFNPA